MSELFPGVRMLAASSRPAQARAASWSLGAGRVVSVQDAASAVERRAERRDAASETFKLLLQTQGEAMLVHCGQHARLAAGDLVLMDGARPFRMEFGVGYRQDVVELPRGWVSRRCSALLGRSGERLAAAEPEHQLLFRATSAIVEQLPRLAATQRAPLLDAVMGLLAAFACPQPAASSRTDDRFTRACADLDAHLADPDLDAARLARLQGISRRHLDAVFAARGESPERRIWARRLERIRQALQDPACSGRSLIEIAFAWGFNSQAHFSRAFRRQYGQSPSAFRRLSPVPRALRRAPLD
jgi:AraC family transcriptional regulator, positive regulator of tynA and feaB